MDCTATLCYEVARPKKSPAKIDKGPIQDPAEGLKIQGGTSNDLVHGLRTPNEAFFHQNPKPLGLGRQFGQVNFGAFRVFSADLSAAILEHLSL